MRFFLSFGMRGFSALHLAEGLDERGPKLSRPAKTHPYHCS